MIQVCVCVCIYAKVDGVCDRKSFERRKTETAARTAGLLCVTIAIKAGPLSGYRGMGGGASPSDDDATTGARSCAVWHAAASCALPGGAPGGSAARDFANSVTGCSVSHSQLSIRA